MKLIYPSSVTKQQLQQQHVYDYVTKPLTHDHPVSSNNDFIVMDENPAYDKGTVFTNECIKANEDVEYEDVEYEIMDPQSRQTKTDDIKMDENPSYVETRFNS